MGSLNAQNCTVLTLPGWLGSGPAHWQSRWDALHGHQRVEQHDWQRPLRGDWQARLDEVVANVLAGHEMPAQPLLGMTLATAPLPAAPLPDVPVHDVPLPKAQPPESLLNTEQTMQWIRRQTTDLTLKNHGANSASQADRSIILVAHSLGCHLVAAWAAASRQAGRVRGALLVAPPDLSQADLPAELLSWRKPLAQRELPFPSLCVFSHNDPFASPAASLAMAARWGSRSLDIGERGHVNGDSGLGDWPAGLALVHALAAMASDSAELTPSAAPAPII